MIHRHSSRGIPPQAGRGRAILPLPDDVVAQIKSSTTIHSLNGVVLELLKNALDAHATKIDATVDWVRGSCTVEDNGLGIAPIEFREEGGLGKLYCTSRHSSHEPCFGRNGTFLASLAAMSLLTITSHHHEHRSHNSVTFHHSKIIDRRLPVHPQHEAPYKDHGTRVTVRNLFGNLPVRVKQRAVAVEQKSEHDRLRDTLRQNVTGLLLGCRGSLGLRIRDADNTVILNFNSQGKSTEIGHKGSGFTEIQRILNTLTQAEYIGIDDWKNWVPASAATPSVSVKGAISLQPAPTKHVQFVTLGINPISSESSHSELYNVINRIFTLSSFGIVEDDADVDEHEKLRRRNDKRFKTDGFTQRQLRGRKSVDRHPMFYLSISLKSSASPGLSSNDFLDEDTNLQAVVEVLEALITQWLAAHHFRPQKPRSRQNQRDAPVSAVDQTREYDSTASDSSGSSIQRGRPASTSSRSAQSLSVKRKRGVVHEPERMPQRPFTEWSRIKSGKPEFLDNLWNSKSRRPQTESPASTMSERQLDISVNTPERSHDSPSELQTSKPVENEQSATDLDNDSGDKVMSWTDPVTKQTHLLNARTGWVIPQRPATSRPGSSQRSEGSWNGMNKSLRLRPGSANSTDAPFLNEILRTWDNPIFRPTEKPIPRITTAEFEFNANDSSHSHCSHISIEKAFGETPMFGNTKLSKLGLQHSRVISQVDRKFILLDMSDLDNADKDSAKASSLLVLVDQHAADERIRVEKLLNELCTPLRRTNGSPDYRSQLGHRSNVAFTLLDKPLQYSVSSRESDLFVTHAARFAAWGILYDIKSPSSTPMTSKAVGESPALIVTTLPPSISERCKSDPKLLISFLRSAIWKYAEDAHLPPSSTLESSTQEGQSSQDPAAWVRRISSCAPGLVDMISSRACRSAIMFNDELSIQDCEDLVSRLADCVFPFMCAHGRPSMVPLVDLGSVGFGQGLGVAGSGIGSRRDEDEKRGFVSAWKKWKNKD